MLLFAKFLVVVVAILHLYFLVLEMFFWTKPYGLRVFNQSQETANASAALAANQGLYNGFLAAGLIWGLIHPNSVVSTHICLFFLSCVFIAGAYGAYSVNKRILFIQALPAALAIAIFLSV